MNMEYARKMLQEALANGLTLHGLSVNGKPAISFDKANPRARIARRRFQSTDGLVRELLRAAMIEECLRRGLPQSLPLPDEYAELTTLKEQYEPRVLH